MYTAKVFQNKNLGPKMAQVITRNVFGGLYDNSDFTKEQGEIFLNKLKTLSYEGQNLENYLKLDEYNLFQKIITSDFMNLENLKKLNKETLKQNGIELSGTMKEYLEINRELLVFLDDLNKESLKIQNTKTFNENTQNDILNKKYHKDELFGTAVKNFDPAIVTNYLEDGKVNLLKRYLRQYFVGSMEKPCFFMWVPSTGDIRSFAPEKLSHWVKKVSKTEGDFCPYKYIKDYPVRYESTYKVNAPMIIKDEKYGSYQLNHWPGEMHSETKPFNEYSTETKDLVKLMWSHIKNIWCNGEDSVFDYVHNWITHMVCGKKMKTALFITGLQGTGKSLPVTFLMDHVVGARNTLKTQDPSFMVGFNYSIYRIRLLILEELSNSRKEMWQGIQDAMKAYITEDMLQIRRKNHDDFQYTNPLSLILLSNHIVLKMEDLDRRYIWLNPSITKIDDQKYFDEIVKCLDDLVGEAFLAYCKEKVEDYKTQHGVYNEAHNRPVTQLKKEAILSQLNPFYIYLKYEFLLKKKGLDKISLVDLRNKYVAEMHNDAEKMKKGKAPRYRRHETNISAQNISKFLRDLGFSKPKNIFTSTGNRTFVRMSYEELHEIFLKRNYYHELDYDEVAENDEYEGVDILDNEYTEPIQQPEVIEVTCIEQSEVKQSETKEPSLLSLKIKYFENQDRPKGLKIIQEFISKLNQLEKQDIKEEPKSEKKPKTYVINLNSGESESESESESECLNNVELTPKKVEKIKEYVVSFTDEVLDMFDD